MWALYLLKICLQATDLYFLYSIKFYSVFTLIILMIPCIIITWTSCFNFVRTIELVTLIITISILKTFEFPNGIIYACQVLNITLNEIIHRKTKLERVKPFVPNLNIIKIIIDINPIPHYCQSQNCETDCLCAICLTTLKGHIVKKVECQHEFHKECILKWMDVKKECPVCRTRIF